LISGRPITLQGVRGTGRWFSVRKEEDDRDDVGLRWRDWAELGGRKKRSGNCLRGQFLENTKIKSKGEKER
jgi:hypothetical protein